MDHAYIRVNNVVDRYVLRRLPAAESANFEEHFVDCADCQQELATAQEFSQALREASAYDRKLLAVEAPTRVRVLPVWRWAFLGAAACVVLMLPILFRSVRESSRLQDELSRASSDSASWRMRYEALQRSGAETQKQSPPTPAGQPSMTVAGLPVVAAVFPLNITRGAEPEGPSAGDRIVLSKSPQWVVLSLDLDGNEFHSYRATLARSGGPSLWHEEGLAPSPSNTLAITFPSSSFQSGDYLLTLEGLSQGKGYTAAGHYPFHVSFKQ